MASKDQGEGLDHSAEADRTRKFATSLPENLKSREGIMQLFDSLREGMDEGKPDLFQAINDHGRLMLIFVVLCGFDGQMERFRTERALRRALPSSEPRRKRRSRMPNGVGYAPELDFDPDEVDAEDDGFLEAFQGHESSAPGWMSQLPDSMLSNNSMSTLKNQSEGQADWTTFPKPPQHVFSGMSGKVEDLSGYGDAQTKSQGPSFAGKSLFKDLDFLVGNILDQSQNLQTPSAPTNFEGFQHFCPTHNKLDNVGEEPAADRVSPLAGQLQEPKQQPLVKNEQLSEMALLFQGDLEMPSQTQGHEQRKLAAWNQALDKPVPNAMPSKQDAMPDDRDDVAAAKVRAPLVFDQDENEAEDRLAAQVFQALAQLMEALDKSNHDASSTLVDLLSRSSLLDKTAELLRNGCLKDISKRKQLYEVLITFLHGLALLPSTSRLFWKRRVANSGAGHSLLRVALGSPTRMSGEEEETTQSLSTSMKDLSALAKYTLKHPDPNDDSDASRCRGLFRSIRELRRQMKANLSGQGQEEVVRKDSRMNSKGADTWQEAELWVEVDESQIMARFKFDKEATTAHTTCLPAMRMKKLVKDQKLLASELQSAGGIFVRYCSSRPDMMKILMVGPQDTPYENGLFEFDLWCPGDYPSVPPRMHFRTTGRGTVRFNPNLYTDGKVCLSLLGTWGNQWNPAESSIFQVLLSIRSMIFCPEPYCNEPGYEKEYGSEASKVYTGHVRPATVRHAMLDWMDPERCPQMWREVVQKHFQHKEEAILATVREWIGGRPPTRMSRVRTHMQTLGQLSQAIMNMRKEPEKSPSPSPSSSAAPIWSPVGTFREKLQSAVKELR
ncbi:Hypothetical predicted protein [Lecanosticta acicola]|uniref:UBC core domain-containing protein n=1 Tax=Lecanosticta acicola TaxID=111012 RepID=A0AAI8Z846_9PEZI|nr:Hypothetical predicted protein [Lecanosticta acicola]